MAIYIVTMNGEVQAKQRPKFNRKTGVAYTPHNTTVFESTLRMLAQKAVEKAEGKPFENACKVFINITKKVPSSFSKKRRLEMCRAFTPVTTKPDLDNCAKSILDALNGIFYTDDKLVAELSIMKVYGEYDAFCVKCEEL